MLKTKTVYRVAWKRFDTKLNLDRMNYSQCFADKGEALDWYGDKCDAAGQSFRGAEIVTSDRIFNLDYQADRDLYEKLFGPIDNDADGTIDAPDADAVDAGDEDATVDPCAGCAGCADNPNPPPAPTAVPVKKHFKDMTQDEKRAYWRAAHARRRQRQING